MIVDDLAKKLENVTCTCTELKNETTRLRATVEVLQRSNDTLVAETRT